MPAKPVSLTPVLIFTLIIFALIASVIWTVRDVLAPFIAGFILAYICAPAVGFMVHRKIPRGIAVSSVMLGIVAFVTLLGVLIVPRLITELAQLISDLPGYAATLKARAQAANWPWLHDIMAERTHEVQKAISNGLEKLTQTISGLFTILLTRGQAVLSGILFFVLTPIIAFYLLLDWPKLIVHLESLIPRRWIPTWDVVSNDMNRALKGYFQGQSLVCLCLALYYSTMLSLTGLNYGFLIGVLAGIFSFVPYVGSIGGLITAMIVALTQFWPNSWPVALVAGVFAVGQILEGYILAPKLVGDKVGLHAVWIFLALFVFGSLMGFSGLILAVPMAALIAVCVRHAVVRYRGSAYYRGNQ